MKFSYYLEKRNNMRLVKDIKVSKELKYHLDKNINLHENVFRIYSNSWYKLINEARILYNKDLLALNDEDAELVESDAGETAYYKGKKVKLDCPFVLNELVNEANYKGKKVNINKPFRTPGENKKFAVYVKTKSGNIKKVRFGDPKLKVKNNNPSRAKSFRARHKCHEKNDKEKPGYWACRIGRYAKSVGLKSNKSW